MDPLEHLYSILDEARTQLGGYRYLRDPQRDLPRQGVYFFFDHAEPRSAGNGLRVVRVGTHAVSAGSSATLGGRLAQHRGALAGANPGGGSHRGSVFRRHVGRAMLAGRKEGDLGERWGVKQPHGARPHEDELGLELEVSGYLRALPLVWVPIADEAGTASRRAAVERGSIALLSNRRSPADPPSPGWLGLASPEPRIRLSGLWNVNHVDDESSGPFLDLLAEEVGRAHRARPV